MSAGLTPSQTVGPFFAIAFGAPEARFVVPEDAPGAFRISGRVLDGAGEPVPDALVETWQADGFARCPTDVEGRFEIVTVKPASVPGLDGSPHAPHLDVSVFARGLLQRVVTRIYFGDEEEANDSDALLQSLSTDDRSTLVAEPIDGGYRFDVRLQGERETTFFAL
jgi:protocatechuate 3,4-dioxygenase alpha subunit